MQEVFRLHQYKRRSRRREWENGVRIKRSIRRERKNDTTEAYLISLLLLAGDVELNPGPVTITCTTCKQTFNRRSRLNYHQATATPTACYHCNRTFCFENRLHQHKRTEHSEGGIANPQRPAESIESMNTWMS